MNISDAQFVNVADYMNRVSIYHLEFIIWKMDVLDMSELVYIHFVRTH